MPQNTASDQCLSTLFSTNPAAIDTSTDGKQAFSPKHYVNCTSMFLYSIVKTWGMQGFSLSGGLAPRLSLLSNQVLIFYII